jgi:nucleotide-binding universal stress UspA family protein
LHVFDAPALQLVGTREMPRDQRAHYLEDARLEAGRALAHFLGETGAGPLEQTVRPVETTAANGILAAAEEVRADLVVVGTRGLSGLARLILGSVAESVLRTAERDVLAVPPAPAG